jgi:hypothetical protein
MIIRYAVLLSKIFRLQNMQIGYRYYVYQSHTNSVLGTCYLMADTAELSSSVCRITERASWFCSDNHLHTEWCAR